MPTRRRIHRPPAKRAAPAPKPAPIPATAKLVSARQVRELVGGRSEMWLYRMLTERPEAKFPRCAKINGRNYWRRAEIEAWIAAQFREAAA